jgi:DNA-directed RNA polymerase subunit M/transcription elongation factor TFIIS
MFRVPFTSVSADGKHAHSEFKITHTKWASLRDGTAEQLDAFVRTKARSKGYFKSWTRFGAWSFDSVDDSVDDSGDTVDVDTGAGGSTKHLLYAWAYTKGTTPHPAPLCLNTAATSADTLVLPYDDVLLLLVQGADEKIVTSGVDLERCVPITDAHVEEWQLCVTPEPHTVKTAAETHGAVQHDHPPPAATMGIKKESSQKRGSVKTTRTRKPSKPNRPRKQAPISKPKPALQSPPHAHHQVTSSSVISTSTPHDIVVFDGPSDTDEDSDGELLNIDNDACGPLRRKMRQNTKRGGISSRKAVGADGGGEDEDGEDGDPDEEEEGGNDEPSAHGDDDEDEDDEGGGDNGDSSEDDLDDGDDDDVLECEELCGLVSAISIADDGGEDDDGFAEDPADDADIEALVYEDYECEMTGLPLDARTELPTDMRLRPTGMSMTTKPIIRSNVVLAANDTLADTDRKSQFGKGAGLVRKGGGGGGGGKRSRGGTAAAASHVVVSAAFRLQCSESGDRMRDKVRLMVLKHLRRIDGGEPNVVGVKAQNIEKSVFNASIHKAHWIGTGRSWSNPTFADLYLQRAKSVLSNLDPQSYLIPPGGEATEKNRTSASSSSSLLSSEPHRLAYRVCTGEVPAHKVAFLKPSEIHPEKWRSVAETHAKKQAPYTPTEFNTMHRCGKCGARKTTVYEMQTRSADEPMTLFITCHNCKNHWRK